MSIAEKFLNYVSYPTTSNDEENSSPTSDGQMELAKVLVKELQDLGLADAYVSSEGIVMASLNGKIKGPTIGLIAHLDTSPDASGINIHPRIIKNYQGEVIKLNDLMSLDPAHFNSLKNNIGHDLIVTDGTTLLGGDDKAGIAIIMQLLEELIESKADHLNLRIAFTPDEEIGAGVNHFNVKEFNSDYAYTIDGGASSLINKENFNGATSIVTLNGLSIHPGSAKDKMINASIVANEFISLLPKLERPEHTENREGFYHLISMQGECSKAVLEFILRDHDLKLLKKKESMMDSIADKLNKQYGTQVVTVKTEEKYFNMIEKLNECPESLKRIEDAYKKLNLPYSYEPIRGGTDGARLSFEGLPCPNLGTGDYNCHGNYEYVSITEMERMVSIILEMVKN